MKNDKHLKIYNFEFGTITDTAETVKIDMDNKQFTHDTVAELKDNMITDNNKLFLPLVDIKESETDVTFYYSKSRKLTNLMEIKKEEYPVKISIAEEILETDILNKYEEDVFISLNPANLYYYPMNTVTYTYTANKYMPRTQHTKLDRYKASVISILSGIPYEKCLSSKEEVKKEGNELIKEIYNQTTREDLLEFIRDSEDYITYDYITNTRNKEKKTNRIYQYIIGGIIVLGLAGVVFIQANASKSQLDMAENYEQQLEEKDILLQANQEFQNENYDEAVQLYRDVGYDLPEIAHELALLGQYQLALDTDESSLEQVIQTLYENEEEEILSDLNIENLSDELQGKVADELTIISEDTSAMENVLNFLSDEHTAERLTQKYIELGNIGNAKQIQEQYPDNQVINNIIEQAEESSQLQENIEQQISDLEEQRTNLEEADEDNQDEIDDLTTQIEELNNELNELNNDE